MSASIPGLALLCAAAVFAPARANAEHCGLATGALLPWAHHFEAQVATVDANGHVERVEFPWLGRAVDDERPLKASASISLSGFGWHNAAGADASRAPGTSRYLSIVQEGPILRVSIAEPHADKMQSARLSCRDGLWSGSAAGHAWMILHLRTLAEPRTLRRIDYTRPSRPVEQP
jgi:hypothetical protein